MLSKTNLGGAVMPDLSFDVKGKKILVVTDDHNQIRDIQVSTTYDDYKNKLLPKLHDLNITTKNTPYARMFRNPLAQFEAKTQHKLAELQFKKSEAREKSSETLLNDDAEKTKLESMLALKRSIDKLSGLYDQFDKYINQSIESNPIENPNGLLAALETLEKELETVELENLADHDLKRQWVNLRANLENNRAAFQNEIIKLRENIPTNAQTKQLLSIQDQDENIPSLGKFVAEQLIQIGTVGIKMAYHISDNRLKDMIHVPPLVAALSDAKKMLELKARSLDGAEYNDAYSKMPLSPMGALDELLQKNGINKDLNPEVTFSLKPYISNWNVSDLDELVCLITDTPLVARETPFFLFGVLKLVASFIELFAVMFIRLPITLALACVDLTGRILGISADKKWTDSINDTLSEWHEKGSLVIWSKQLWNTHYKRNALDKNGLLTETQHQELLDTIKNEVSYFHLIANEYTPSKMASALIASVKTAYRNLKQIPQDLRYLSSNSNAETVYRNVVDQHSCEREAIAQRNKEKSKAIIALLEQDFDSEETTSAPSMRVALDEALKSLSSQGAFPQQLTTDHLDSKEEIEGIKSILCPLPRYATGNHIVSPFEVPREVVYAITDGMVDPFFRKSPATSTLFFVLSATTFGTYILPAALFAGMKSAVFGLQIPTNLLSKAFTGRYVVEGMQEASVASFLEWQALVLSSELGIELNEEHYDVLAELFHEPEKISMALVGLVGVGIGLQFIPILPSAFTIPGTSIQCPIIYTSLLNLFTEEAKSSAHGIYPFSLITKLILGLKAALLAHSMVTSASHEPHAYHEQNGNSHAIAVDDTEHESYNALLEAITILSDPNSSLDFSSDPFYGANKFYDHLHTLFDAYNHELQRRGRADLCLDKHDLLNAFYNKYCKQDVNNVLCILSIFPAYPLTLAWRAFKWLWATAYNKPSIAHQVEVQFHKDKVLLLQLVGMLTKMTYSVGLALSYTLRPIAALTLFLATVIPFLVQRLFSKDPIMRKQWFQTIDAWSCNIALHELDPASFLRPVYARSAREAGSNTNVVEMSERVQTSMVAAQGIFAEPVVERRESLPYIDTTSKLGKLLERHDRAEHQESNKTESIKQEMAPLWGASAASVQKSLGVKSPSFFARAFDWNSEQKLYEGETSSLRTATR